MNKLCFVIGAVLLIGALSAQGESCAAGCWCTDEIMPVCGNDYTTYDNECLLECARCEKADLVPLFEGPCEDVVFAVPSELRISQPPRP